MVKALITDDRVSEELITRRRALGYDRWDEVWDGVVHMVPSPNFEHQRIEGDLREAFKEVVTRTGMGVVVHGLNVADPIRGLQDFRIPDISVVLSSGRAKIVDTYIAGGPDLVVEIRSPGDETHEKLSWYAMQGVREALVIGQDTKWLELYRLQDGVLVRVASSPGVVESQVVPLRFEQVQRQGKPVLLVTHTGDPAKRWEI